MPDPFDYVYPLPAASPLEDIREWIPLLLAAVDAELDRDGVWNDDDLDAALGYVQDLKAWLAEFEPMTHPVGIIASFGGSSAPDGWLLCEGQAVSRTAYASLFAIVGTTYGAGDGTTTFNIPDLRGRAAVGAGAGPSLTARTPGSKWGSETHTLSVNEIPAHSHALGISYQAAMGAGSSSTYRAGGTINTGVAGGGLAHNNMQPSLALNFIIRAV